MNKKLLMLINWLEEEQMKELTHQSIPIFPNATREEIRKKAFEILIITQKDLKSITL